MDHRTREPSRDDAPSAERRKKSPPGPPMTVGGTAAAGIRLIVWRRDCGRQVEPDPAEKGQKHGAGTPRSRIGANGWSAPSAAAGRSIRS
jgi:hypothetical protein